MPRREWSCEHCGYGTRDAARTCDYCSAAMCESCTDEHDEREACPIDGAGRRDEAADIQARLTEAVAAGEAAFWAAVRERFPEASSGAVPREAERLFREACSDAALTWLIFSLSKEEEGSQWQSDTD